ncbi:ATP-binding protein [Kitasatospora sp. NPDC057015]|uniref:ATP-binding protein n=1 Tax=Kitasatospora sp. NPDC057015 TaxID=3346001 RepID=UPI003624BC11
MSFQTPGGTGPTSPGLPLTGQRRRLALSGLKGQVARGRDFTRQALTDWEWAAGLDPYGQSTADDVLLAVSELLANACLHAGGPQELVLAASADGLRVEVLDGDPAVPVPRAPYQPGSPGGHGLHIIERVADRWGVTPLPGGKSVWLEFAAGRLAGAVVSPPAARREEPGTRAVEGFPAL